MRNLLSIYLLLGLVLPVLSACSKSQPTEGPPKPTVPATPPAPPPPPDPAREAADIFDRKCSVCHGTTGHADGPGAAALNPKPQVFVDAAWQDKVKDDEIAKAILGGGVAVGRTPGMPPNPDLQSKPDVVAELVKIVRKYKP
jgi:mono/diheme cytochrome c family protein